MDVPDNITITRIDAAVLNGRRFHFAGPNARLGNHGWETHEPVVRLHTDVGLVGWGWSRAKPDDARALLGVKLREAFNPESGTLERCRMFDFPLWDLTGQALGLPVHTMLGDRGEDAVAVYDGSIYMNDIDPDGDCDRGIQAVLDLVTVGLERGYHSFKVKIGRGFQWMDKEAGFQCDIDVILGVRDMIRPSKRLLIDANNGYSPVEARELMRRVGGCEIYWFEEPFPESREECPAFKTFLHEQGWRTLLADGEGAMKTADEFTDIVRAGGIDVVQFDMRGFTLSRWLSYMPVIEEAGVLAAPHNWGSHLAGFYIAQFGRACPRFAGAEIDTMDMPGVTAAGYDLLDGRTTVPDAAGFGLEIDPAAFASPVWQVP